MDITNAAAPLRYTILVICMILAQVLVCNNILLFGVAIPFIYIFCILVLPLNYNLNLLMVLGFLLGFIVDIFSDTMGLNCLACLILCVVKKPLFYAYMSKDDKFVGAVPSIATMGWANYLKYTVSITAVFCILIFGIDLFSFASFGRILLMTFASTIFTLLLLVASDSLYNSVGYER